MYNFFLISTQPAHVLVTTCTKPKFSDLTHIKTLKLSAKILTSKTHSYPRKILPNSAGQFTKFRGSPQQNYPNSAVYRSLPFLHKLSFIRLLKKTLAFGCWHGDKLC